MGIYLPNMEMPKNCEACELAKHFDGYQENDCPFNAFSYYDCPLIEVHEPHGRLIDEKDICDKIRPLVENPYCYNRLQVISETLGNCLQIVSDAPTIIPANEECET